MFALPQTNGPAVAATDSFGCMSGQLGKNQELSGAGIRFFRKRSDSTALGQVQTPASDRGFLAGISLSTGHRRRIIHGQHATEHDFETGSVYLREFSDDYRADLKGPFDFLLVEISHAFIDRTRDDMRGACSRSLERVAGKVDHVLGHLAMALLPALERPKEAAALFVDQLGLAIGAHLLGNYGGSALPGTRKRRHLSALQESRAKALIRHHIDGSISVADIADACNLSRSYFIRAFRETTGQTPYQWLLAQRVDCARKLLIDSSLSLVDIASACGFADQSHFTRVFTQAQGTPPGTWRRLHS